MCVSSLGRSSSFSSVEKARPPVMINNFVGQEPVQKPTTPSRSAKVAPAPSESVSVAPVAKIQEDVKTSFADTKSFVRKIGDVLSKINTEFDISGGTKATFMDAVTDTKGKLDLSRAVRTTAEYSDKAQKGIDSLVDKGFKGIEELTDSAFRGIDKTFNPKETMSKAIGEFRQAISSSTSKWETFKAGASLAWGTVKAGASAVANGVSKVVVGTGAFVASSAVAITGGAAKLATSVVTPVAGALEGIGRTVVAPVARAVAETTGKVVLGTGAFAVGVLGTVKNVANVGGWMDKVGDSIKDSRLGKWVSEKTSTKSDKTMSQIDSSLAELGISSKDVGDKKSSVKSDRLKAEGHESGELGIKDTMKKWFQIGFGKQQTAIMSVSSAISGGKVAATLANGGLNANTAFSSLAAAGQGAVVIGAISSPLTMVGCGYGVYAGIKDHKQGEQLQEKIGKYIESADTKIKGFEGEIAQLKAENKPENAPKIAKLNEQISELNDLKFIAKQESSKIGLGLKKAGIAQNGILALSGAASTAATIGTFVGAGAVVAATGPVGLGLAAAGAVIAGGVVAYKVYKAEKREDRNDKLAAQQQLVDNKINSNPPPSAEDLKKLTQVKEKIVALRMEKDPKFASEQLAAKLTAKSPEAEDFVKTVFGDSVLKADDKAKAIQDKMPIVSGDQRATWGRDLISA